jgi:hypothetical protein
MRSCVANASKDVSLSFVADLTDLSFDPYVVNSGMIVHQLCLGVGIIEV